MLKNNQASLDAFAFVIDAASELIEAQGNGIENIECHIEYLQQAIKAWRLEMRKESRNA